MVFTWKGREIATTGDVVIAMEQLESPEEARAFKNTFIQSERPLVPNPVELVNHNLGYLTGYMDEETRTRLMEWLDVVHPIFGRTAPTPEEAFQAGVSASDPRNDPNWNNLDEETKTDLMQDHADHLETVTFHWSTEHGRCYECGLPAAFYLPYAYGDWNDLDDEEGPQPTTTNKRCAICAANAAAVDDEIVRRIDEEQS